MKSSHFSVKKHTLFAIIFVGIFSQDPPTITIEFTISGVNFIGYMYYPLMIGTISLTRKIFVMASLSKDALYMYMLAIIAGLD